MFVTIRSITIILTLTLKPFLIRLAPFDHTRAAMASASDWKAPAALPPWAEVDDKDDKQHEEREEPSLCAVRIVMRNEVKVPCKEEVLRRAREVCDRQQERGIGVEQ